MESNPVRYITASYPVRYLACPQLACSLQMEER